MFDNIAPRYDLLNQILSAGVHARWRKLTIDSLGAKQPKRILDIATGTADLAIEALRLQPDSVVGVDISEEMLAVGRKKLSERKLDERIELRYGDAEALDFEDESFDAAMVSYGVRNFGDLDQGLSEIRRVLKPGGQLAVLEFSRPSGIVAPFFDLYFRKICPLIGRLVSKDMRAYSYLYESVQAFPSGQEFLDHLSKTGFSQATCKRLTFGISSLYIGTR